MSDFDISGDIDCTSDLVFSNPAVIEELWDKCLIGVAIIKEDGTFLFANPAFCDIVEYSEVELRNRTYQSITHPDDLESDVELAKQTSSLERSKYYMIKRYITKRGKLVNVRLFVNPIKKDGEFLYFLSQIIMLDEEEEEQEEDHTIPTYWKTWAAVLAYAATEVILKLTE